jgi:hypothetical protein
MFPKWSNFRLVEFSTSLNFKLVEKPTIFMFPKRKEEGYPYNADTTQAEIFDQLKDSNIRHFVTYIRNNKCSWVLTGRIFDQSEF